MTGPMLARSFGYLLRMARQDAAMTAKDLAWECRISQQYLSDIENDKRHAPALSLARKLAETVNADVPALIARAMYEHSGALFANDAERRALRDLLVEEIV